MRVDAQSVPIQGQQIRLFRGPRERGFCMNDIAPASLLTDRPRCLLPLLDADSVLARGECHFVNFYRAGRLPDHQIWYVGPRIPCSARKRTASGLTSVLPDAWFTADKQG